VEVIWVKNIDELISWIHTHGLLVLFVLIMTWVKMSQRDMIAQDSW
jgi:hypothetical protein